VAYDQMTADLLREKEQLQKALEALIPVTAGLARRGDLIDQALAVGAIQMAEAALKECA
jgi:hypothetical protein